MNAAMAVGSTTLSAAEPDLPSLVAVMVALPGPTVVTSPALETVATLPLDVAHVTVRPLNTAPWASFVVAASCTVAPASTLGAFGETSTDATGVGVGFDGATV